MSSHETRVWETPGEEHLATLMGRASNLIVPGTSYSLKLDAYGVVPKRATFEELQARFSVNLDREKGSDMHMTLDNNSGSLVLDQFSAPLTNERGTIHMDKGHGRLMSYIVTNGGGVRLSHAASDARWQAHIAENLLAAHDIETEAPVEIVNYYRMWLGHNVLSKCRSWDMMEKLELNRRKRGNKVSALSIIREQAVPQDGNTAAAVETISILSEITEIREDKKITDNEVLTLKSYLDMEQAPSLNRSSYRIETELHQDVKINHVGYHDADASDVAAFTTLVEEILEKS